MAYVTFVEHKLGTAQAGPASADMREGISARASASPLLAVSLTSRRWPRSRRGLSTPRVAASARSIRTPECSKLVGWTQAVFGAGSTTSSTSAA
jgi:hypothetical protein